MSSARIKNRIAVTALGLLAAAALSAPATAGARNLSAGGEVSDTGAMTSPIPFWGQIDCQNSSRQQLVDGGGDWHGTAEGVDQGNDAYRELTVYDGDDIWGERCELGENNRRSSPVAMYHEGQRLITYISIRLPGDFPLDAETWQAVMQMKQVGPSANSRGTPVLELDAWGDQWRLRQSKSPGYAEDSRQLWTAPAQSDTWTRFAFDVKYSRKPGKGRIQVYADLNSDGDFDDSGEVSERMKTYTLKREIRGGYRDGLKAGKSIPSHLRAGIYHDEALDCGGGCSVDIDNVQVVRP